MPWADVRPWRNNNPGDLRTLPAPEAWYGQSAVDDSPGGPFAAFSTRTLGWRALGVCLLTYQRRDGCKTVRQIINRWAPPSDNNPTAAYVAFVASRAQVTPDGDIDLSTASNLLNVASAIAAYEGGSEIAWPAEEMRIGVGLALAG